MLPQTTLVKVRKAIEKTYVHFCNVIVKEEYTKKIIPQDCKKNHY